jgi:hypothetical protein
MKKKILSRDEFSKRFLEHMSYVTGDETIGKIFSSSDDSDQAYELYSKKENDMTPEDYVKALLKFKDDGIELDSMWQLPRFVGRYDEHLKYLLVRLEDKYGCKTVDDLLKLTNQEIYCTTSIGQVVYRTFFQAIESFYNIRKQKFPKAFKVLLNSIDKCEIFKLIIPSIKSYSSLKRFTSKWNENNPRQQFIWFK